ncbi:MAG: VOC family protein [Streptosporangiaceae bacterium]
MTSRLNPYVSFDGKAREALEFYQATFGGTLDVKTFGEFGAAGSPIEHNVMHGMLETPAGFTLMAGDTPPGMEYKPGNDISISLSGDDAEELRGYWEKISASGTVANPLEKQVWGDEFGSCQDKYGIHWLVNITAR